MGYKGQEDDWEAMGMWWRGRMKGSHSKLWGTGRNRLKIRRNEKARVTPGPFSNMRLSGLSLRWWNFATVRTTMIQFAIAVKNATLNIPLRSIALEKPGVSFNARCRLTAIRPA